MYIYNLETCDKYLFINIARDISKISAFAHFAMRLFFFGWMLKIIKIYLVLSI